MSLPPINVAVPRRVQSAKTYFVSSNTAAKKSKKSSVRPCLLPPTSPPEWMHHCCTLVVNLWLSQATLLGETSWSKAGSTELDGLKPSPSSQGVSLLLSLSVSDNRQAALTLEMGWIKLGRSGPWFRCLNELNPSQRDIKFPQPYRWLFPFRAAI